MRKHRNPDKPTENSPISSPQRAGEVSGHKDSKSYTGKEKGRQLLCLVLTAGKLNGTSNQPGRASKLNKEKKMTENVPFGAIKEAIASCRLDGETMSCERCPLGKDYRKQLIEELQAWKIIDDEPVIKLIIPIEWWQQFKDKELK